MTASLVNQLIKDLQDDGYMEVVNRQVRPYAYSVTEDGYSYVRRLSHEHYHSVLESYRQLQERIRGKLHTLRNERVKRIVCYGGGEVMEATYPLALALGFEVVGVVDDDPTKQGTRRNDLVVKPPSAIAEMEPDLVVITTLRHGREILERMPEAVRGSVPVVEL